MNAAIELARAGYVQEIGVLIRTIVECTTHIEFVLSDLDAAGHLGREGSKYIEDYFLDFERNEVADFKRPKVRQGDVHKTVGASLDSFAMQTDRRPAERLLSNVYLTFSNYVHARYPEVMDMYGGEPARFHMAGMSGSPKDLENVEMLDVQFTSVSQALARIAQSLKLKALLESDPVLHSWYQSVVS